ncbi:hypothetical protein BBJ28_00023179, partial [Nothophytophthora sp. Chile5]
MDASLHSPSGRSYATFGRNGYQKPLPVVGAIDSWSSRLLFSNVTPLMELGNERQLDSDDLQSVQGKNKASAASRAFRKHYNQAGQSLAWAIVRSHGSGFLLCGLALVFSTVCSVFAPAVLQHLMEAFSAPELDMHDLVLWLGAFFASRLLNAVVGTQMNYYLKVMALRVAVSLQGLLLWKCMRRSTHSRSAATSVVDMSNLFTSDILSVLEATYVVNKLWILPIQIAVVMAMLYAVIDLAAFAGLAVILLSMLASFAIAKFTGKAFGDIMKRKDQRLKTVKEVFAAIQIIKLNVWEGKFADKICQLRSDELSAVTRYMYATSLSIFTLWSTPLFVSTVSFAVYTIAMGEMLTATQVFTAIALFNALRDPLRDLPTVIQQCIQARVSLGRVSEYLALEEYEPANVIRTDPALPKSVAIAVRDGSFGWDSTAVILKGVDLEVKKGELVVVHGAVGSGKSSLCSALLGEMKKLSGSVFVRGSVAYYSQQSWIQNLTIRDNILFGLEFNAIKYERVLRVCGLRPDLAQFSGGDATEVGQRGVTLSGGQKARVSLARACYADADVLILDSPLAAVDAVVQRDIFDNCICGFLASKTVVLITHSPEVIASKAVNCKVLVEDGKLTVTRCETSQPKQMLAGQPSDEVMEPVTRPENQDKTPQTAGTLVEEEARQAGRVSTRVFMRYFNSLGGIKVCVALCVIQTAWQGFQIGSDLWLSHWTGQQHERNDGEDATRGMRVYAMLSAGSAAMVLARSTTVVLAGLRASRHLSQAMTRSLVKAPLRFFDTNPIGRIVNRYSDDLTIIDFDLPIDFGALLALSFLIVFQLATAVYTVSFLGVLIVPLVIAYVRVGKFYLAPSREVSRLWRTSSSPVLSHITQAEDGVAVVRAFGMNFVERMIAESFARIDTNSNGWLAVAVTTQWFLVRMQLLGSGVVIFIVTALVYLREVVSPDLVGVAFTYALSVDGGLANLVRVWSWLESEMVCPERVLEYASIPAEDSAQALVLEPPELWPHHGSIQFDNVVFNYKEGGAPVLKGLSFDIKSDEKIGIVGRTGAGKSSLTMALFRINELVSGRILIDGVDIATMPLHTLRSRMSIIPQSPVLFKGTLRAYM